jgi:VanZ family protein
MFLQILLSWAPAALWASALFYLSHQPILPGPALPVSDKVLHLVAYLILGITLAWAGRRSRKTMAHLAFLGIGILFALSDEWHQSFVPRRDPSAGDFLADFLGVLLGYALTRWSLNRWSLNHGNHPG